MRRLFADPFVWLLLVVALAVRLIGVDDPWSSRIWEGEFGAYATGGPATNLAQFGFLSTGGVPLEWRVVTEGGGVFEQHYLNHPPTYMWLAGLFVWLFGAVEWGLRLLPILTSTLACVAGYAFARRFAGVRAGRVAALVWAFAPYGLRDGLQLWTEVPIAATMALALLCYVRWLERRERRDLVHLCLWYGLACALDWPAFFFGPVIALHALGVARSTHTWRPLLAPAILFGVSVAILAAIWVHFGSVVGFDVLSARFDQALGSADGSDMLALAGSDVAVKPQLNAAFWSVQLHGFVVGITPPGFVLGLLGLVLAALSRRPRREIGLLLLAGLPGLVYVAAFPGRSANHLFFFTISLASYATLVGMGAEGLARGAQVLLGDIARRAGTVVALACSAAIVVAGLQQHLELRAVSADDALGQLTADPYMVDLLADEQALIVTPAGLGAWLPFYARGQVVLMPDLSPVVIGGLRVRWLTQLADERRAVVFLDEGSVHHPSLPESHREAFAAALDALIVGLERFGEPHVIEFTDSLGMEHRFSVHELPTGEAARSFSPSPR
ncbi:hypothetical protein Pla163_24420 [Planctomycetes bacterium Pla163]|uniref:Glycosyltransferase RgtA/B/C/D-like domain-containing protein n=1 Tax=Rohdeia mirabilis TaxID=2528008 RepID=A0A518D1G8_9BACT|nr:hypothetical protein Pla163_24420 [Planctomycetes bacterium Pla163]